MSAPDVYQWPLEWLMATSARFNLRSFSQSSMSPWSQSRSVYGPHAQYWMCEMSITPQQQEIWRPMAGFIAALDGTARLIRIADVTRLVPQRDLESTAIVEPWSDGTFFDDGSGWISGLLPETIYLVDAADRGDISVVVGGLPVSAARVLRRGDLFEIRPNGIPATTPHLYMCITDAPTDADGETRLDIRPQLRSGVAAGDMVVLKNPHSVFRLADDEQGFLEITVPSIAHFGLKLIEAVV